MLTALKFNTPAHHPSPVCALNTSLPHKEPCDGINLGEKALSPEGGSAKASDLCSLRMVWRSRWSGR